MHVRRLGTWFAILAIALQAAWPLLAAAKPRSVALVPVCTVDGVTHYFEVPTGKAPLDDSVHGQHCVFCTLGIGALLSSHADVLFSADVLADRIVSRIERSHSRPLLLVLGARAPPLSSVVTAGHNNFGGQGGTIDFPGRPGVGAHDGISFMRLGLLHGRYAVEHAGSHD